jgi:dCMP deaminase
MPREFRDAPVKSTMHTMTKYGWIDYDGTIHGPEDPMPTELRGHEFSNFSEAQLLNTQTLDTMAFAGQREIREFSGAERWAQNSQVYVAPTPGPYILPGWTVAPPPSELGIMGRPTWDQTFLKVAEIFSFRGTCPARQVGAVITSQDHHLLATGYNGAPSGLSHCSEVGCSKDASGRCTRAVHAEMNAILQAAYIGISLKGCLVYCTDRPCLNCAKHLIQIGAMRVLWLRDDLDSPDRDEILDILTRASVEWGVYKAK